MPEIEALDDCDLVAIQDAVRPPDALDTMGVVVSAGFFVVPAPRPAGSPVTPLAQLREGAPDDRTAFYRALVAQGSLGSVGPSDAPDVPISRGGLQRLATAPDSAIAVE